MTLSKATPQQMAAELRRRGLDFVLIVNDGADLCAYHPTRISQDKAGVFKLIRDYLNHLEANGVTITETEY